MWNAASRQFFLNQAKPYPYATGGDYVYLYEDTTTGKTYRVHEFLSTGTSTLNVEVGGQMDILVVGGGGGGGLLNDHAGGGGGAGLFVEKTENVSAGSYSVTVGIGGPGDSAGGNSNTNTDGTPSSFSGNYILIEADGGGGGGEGFYATLGRTGGSGGGAGGGGSQQPAAGGASTATGPYEYGNVGGNGIDGGGGNSRAGGGGGAGSAGGNATSTNSGNGGSGREWLNGKVYAAGGGGSAGRSTGVNGDGGSGIGGNGGTDWSRPATSGKANTGSGGGGAKSTAAGAGGSGIVIVRYVVAERKLWTPSELTSLKAWWDVSDENSVTVTSSRVSQLNDKSGNSLNLTDTGSTGPTYTTNGLNGLPVMTFGGTEWLSAASAADWKFLHDGTQTTVMCVAKFGNSSDPNELCSILGTNGNSTSNIGFAIGYDDRTSLDGTRNNASYVFLTGGGSRVASYIDASNVVRSEFNNRINPNQQNIVICLADPSNATASNRIKVSVNSDTPIGNNIYTNTPSNSNPTHTLELGNVGGGLLPTTGTISEVIILEEKVDDLTRRKLEGYLAHKWGLTNNLPSGHPYKYEPPYKVEPEEIVTDGLVLNLDAGDYASYPRSGTTWYDISGNGNNGTLTNGPTYDSANKGSIVFDGTNDYVAVGNDSSNQITTSLTLEAWVYPTQFDHTNIKEVIAKWDNRQYKLAIAGTIFGVPYGRFYIDVSDTGSNDNYRRSSSTLTLNSWNHIVGVYTSGASPSLNVYLNGTLDNGNLVGSVPSSIYNGTSPVYIGSHQGRAFKGNIANVRIYNRALSSTEVQQNFNALRGRYGV